MDTLPDSEASNLNVKFSATYRRISASVCRQEAGSFCLEVCRNTSLPTPLEYIDAWYQERRIFTFTRKCGDGCARKLRASEPFGRLTQLRELSMCGISLLPLHPARRFNPLTIGSPGSRFVWLSPLFEVPATNLEANRLFRHADFGRIGINDLVQYFFVADRTHGALGYDERFDSPLLWEVIAGLVASAASVDKPLGLCGAIAGDARFIPRILRAGVKEISTQSRQIAALRRAAQLCAHETS